MTEAGRLEVGRIGRAHGLRGEIAVTLSSERVERLTPGASLWAGDRELVVARARPHQHRWLVCFDGVDDRTAAEALQGEFLTADALPTDEDEFWVHELIGAVVQAPDGAALGTVVAVEANPASDLLVLDGDRLVPLVFVVRHEPGLVVVDPPDGLWD
ncbi:MAG: ribosome maturation factor RimM [Acidimicrobiia bacterium]